MENILTSNFFEIAITSIHSIHACYIYVLVGTKKNIYQLANRNILAITNIYIIFEVRLLIYVKEKIEIIFKARNNLC